MPFAVDRPLLLYIVDDTFGAVLFQGRIARFPVSAGRGSAPRLTLDGETSSLPASMRYARKGIGPAALGPSTPST